jgi:hypothetical protein
LQFSATAHRPQDNAWMYSPHPDGKRFLVNTMTDTDPPVLNLILHWQQGLSAARP